MAACSPLSCKYTVSTQKEESCNFFLRDGPILQWERADFEVERPTFMAVPRGFLSLPHHPFCFWTGVGFKDGILQWHHSSLVSTQNLHRNQDSTLQCNCHIHPSIHTEIYIHTDRDGTLMGDIIRSYFHIVVRMGIQMLQMHWHPGIDRTLPVPMNDHNDAQSRIQASLDETIADYLI